MGNAVGTARFSVANEAKAVELVASVINKAFSYPLFSLASVGSSPRPLDPLLIQVSYEQ